MRTTLGLLIFLLTTPFAWAGDAVVDLVERYARQQSQGLPGEVQITVSPLAPSTQMPACQRLEAFSPPGTRLWGKTSIGVRCLAPQAWSILVPTHIRVMGFYVVTAKPLAAGQTLTVSDIASVTGDLTTLPTGIVADPMQAIGKTTKNSLGAGQPLRSDQLQAPFVIRQGQTVRVVSSGAGFSVSSEGKAINNAAEGQVAQIRMSSGQTVSGIARSDGTAEISF